jgi:hypothetical protein
MTFCRCDVMNDGDDREGAARSVVLQSRLLRMAMTTEKIRRRST